MTEGSPATPILRVEALSKCFGSTQALDQAAFELRPGEVHALVGENGAGKSTLIHILSGLYTRDDGQILVAGEPVRIGSVPESRALGIAVIYQDPDLAPNLSITDNLLLGQEPEKFLGLVNAGKRRAVARTYLRNVGLEVAPDTAGGEISVAQRQLVALAKAVSQNARILIMDEPTSALAPDETQTLLALIRRLKDAGTSIIFISHKLDEVFAIAQRITVFRDGRTIGTRETARTSVNELISMMVGRDIQALYPAQRGLPGNSLMEVCRFSGNSGFRDISFTLAQGEILGLYGLKGAGRTALLRGLFGLEKIQHGELLLGGEPASIRSPADAIRQGLGLVAEDRQLQSLIPNLNVMENLSLVGLDSLSRRGFVNRAEERQGCREMVRRLNIRISSLQQPISELSGGNQQKVILARWLFSNTRVLLLDEPTAGVDVGAKAEIYRLVEELAASGMGILFVTSELPELLGVSHRVLVMADGTLAGQFSREAATEERIMHAIQARQGAG